MKGKTKRKSKEIYCAVCKHKIEEEYLEDPITHRYVCLSCAGAAMDELLRKYPTAIAD